MVNWCTESISPLKSQFKCVYLCIVPGRFLSDSQTVVRFFFWHLWLSNWWTMNSSVHLHESFISQHYVMQDTFTFTGPVFEEIMSQAGSYMWTLSAKKTGNTVVWNLKELNVDPFLKKSLCQNRVFPSSKIQRFSLMTPEWDCASRETS